VSKGKLKRKSKCTTIYKILPGEQDIIFLIGIA